MVGKIFTYLTSTFPKAVDIDASSVGIEVVSGWVTGPSGLSELNPPSQDESFFGHCVHWLIAEGYVRVDKSWDVSFREAVLTQKALILTGLEPSIIKFSA